MEMITDVGGTMNSYVISICPLRTLLNMEQKSPKKAKSIYCRISLYTSLCLFRTCKTYGRSTADHPNIRIRFNGDPSYLRTPRAKEHEIYDFIYKECEEIKNQLGNANSQTRANYYTALALESRAMLYAGSIAKYNALKTPNIVTSGGEVGIPSDMANGYYQKSLSASKEIIEEGGYELYNKEEDKGINFYKMLMDKTGNKEVIWVKDYQNPLKVHSFGYDNVIHH